MTIDFANNDLNGKSRWRAEDFRDYDTSRTRVCVTVGMMTTGCDCEDVLNVVLARPNMSPTDFIQIKGRGTRLFNFKHGEGAEQRSAKKDAFALFDFIAFLLDPSSRLLLEQGQFATLRAHDPNLFGSLQQLAPAEREELVGCLQSQVPLKEFERVA